MGLSSHIKNTNIQGRIILRMRELEMLAADLKKENMKVVNINRELYKENQELHKIIMRLKE